MSWTVTPSLRARLLALCAAGYGLAVAIAISPLWLRPAPPGQLPGAMTAAGLDAHASFRFFASVLLLPAIAAFALRPALLRLAANDARSWSRNAFAGAAIAALWVSILTKSPLWVALPPLLVLAVCLPLRRTDARFRRADVILIPTFELLFMALCDCTDLSVDRVVLVAAGIVFALRIGLVVLPPGGLRPGGLPPALCFAIAPLGLLLQTQLLARDQRHFGWGPIALVIISTIVLRLTLRDRTRTRHRVRQLIAFAVYPLAVYAYIGATGIVAAEGKPRVDLFEDAQHLVPAGEMLRGEIPYRDIIPPHGLIQDAGIDYLALQSRPVTIGKALKVRGQISTLHAVATYAVAAAATGSPEVGLCTFFVSVLLNTATATPRVLPSLIALAFACAALRRRRPRLFVGAGAFFVVAGLTSIDFSLYTAVALLVAIALFGNSRGDKLQALKFTAFGALLAGLPAALLMLMGGFLGDFFTVSLREVATLGPVYALPPFSAPPGFLHWRGMPEILLSFFDVSSTVYLIWIVTLLVTVAAVIVPWSAHGRKRRALQPLLVLAVFVLVCGVAYAERHNLHCRFAMAPLVAVALFRLFRARWAVARMAAPLLVLMLLMAGNLTTHVAIVGWLRRTRTLTEQGWGELPMARAQGASFKDRDVGIVTAVSHYVNTRLGPDETFFDFTNRGMLHFLLDRDCPVRQIEPAFYESEERQREVIARLEANRKVRAAIVPRPGDGTGVDNIGNDVRAPLVWAYLRQHYQPDFEEGEVTIWTRTDPR
jgi:hypothetical protein